MQHSIALNKAALSLQTSKVVEKHNCLRCANRTSSGCAFDIPEYLTEEAHDCNHFSNRS